MIRLFLALASLCFSLLQAESIKKDPSSKLGNAVADNLDVKGVPKQFMNLVCDYIALSFDHSHLGGDPSLYEKKQDEAKSILNNMRNKYPDDFGRYLTLIAEQGKNPTLRKTAYYVYRKMNANSKDMLESSRKQLRSRDWEDGLHLSSDIHNQLRVLIQYGDQSDLKLWEEIWSKMDERERHTFKNYGKMLTKALRNRADLTRMRDARGDRKNQDELLEKKRDQEPFSALSQNKQIIVGGIALVVLTLIYAVLRFKNRK